METHTVSILPPYMGSPSVLWRDPTRRPNVSRTMERGAHFHVSHHLRVAPKHGSFSSSQSMRWSMWCAGCRVAVTWNRFETFGTQHAFSLLGAWPHFLYSHTTIVLFACHEDGIWQVTVTILRIMCRCLECSRARCNRSACVPGTSRLSPPHRTRRRRRRRRYRRSVTAVTDVTASRGGGDAQHRNGRQTMGVRRENHRWATRSLGYDVRQRWGRCHSRRTRDTRYV